MNIFTDFHHESLYLSFKLLFEKRLNGKVYRPIGLEWFTEGYWKIAEPYDNNVNTVSQFLVSNSQPFPDSKPLNDNISDCITLEQFKAMDIDIVIATIPAHFIAYAELIKKYKPTAKLICHYGNNWIMGNYQQDNVMASIMPQPIPNNVNTVFYHQEFDTNIFCYKEPTISNCISSFINVFDGFPDAQLFYDVEKLMPDYKFRIYGAVGRDGVINGEQNIANSIHNSKFVWHLKKDGDGFGHIIHNIFACGRPAIVKREYYKGQLAEYLMEDGVTCIEVDGLTTQQIVDKLLRYSEPSEYIKLCQNASERFKQIVNFDEEFEEIKIFLDKLL